MSSLHARRGDNTSHSNAAPPPVQRLGVAPRRKRKVSTFRLWNRLLSFLSNNPSTEKLTVGLLLLVAWGWIIVTIGMIFYHGYYSHRGNFHSHAWGDIVQQQQHQPTLVVSGPEAVLEPVSLSVPESLPAAQMQQRRQGNLQATSVGASPLLIFTYKRSDYLRTTLEDVFRFLPRDCSVGCPLIISQDGALDDVTGVIREFQDKFAKVGVPLVHWQHPQNNQPNLRRGLARIAGAKAYAALAQHYQWALDQLFSEPPLASDPNSPFRATPAQRVIILEEDLHIAPDFFSYFQAMTPLLDRDPTLLAVSAYNDNGLQGKVHDTARLVRSDFFPGLGWMMTRHLWTGELSRKWPQAYWDDWLREPPQRQGRHIVRPEVSRTFHFGTQGGASNNQYGSRLSGIWLNPTSVDWSTQDLSYLEADLFDRAYGCMVMDATTIAHLDQAEQIRDTNVRIEYRDLPHFATLARQVGIFPEEKAGVPRTAYKGVVETRWHGSDQLLFLTPPLEQLKMNFDLTQND